MHSSMKGKRYGKEGGFEIWGDRFFLTRETMKLAPCLDSWCDLNREDYTEEIFSQAVLISEGCCYKVPHPEHFGLKKISDVSSHSSGGQQFKLKVLAESCSLQRLQGRIRLCFFQLPPVAGNPQCFLFLDASFQSLHHHMAFSSVCVSVSPFSLLTKTPVIELGPTVIQYDVILT